ncbi:MAG TPA: hypothetical protein VET26_03545 [Candidatus Sulfotelmatobacter sp.]|nr:hypothetical protein [Candidatus Sulfotelmatobacter sp.]
MLASTQASAALIGLLFVSVSIAPDRVFGGRAEAGRQVLAVSAFTALANVFFVSFSSLIPHLSFGVFVVVAGTVAALQTLILLLQLPRWRQERSVIRSLSLFTVSAVIYGYEIAIGFKLIFTPASDALMTGLLQLLLGGYAIGLARAWELLGASPGRGPVSRLVQFLESRISPTRPAADPARSATAGARQEDST